MPDVLCILAGGRSSRFGSSKLAVHVEGQPVLTWLARRLGGGMAACWLSAAPGPAPGTPPPGAAVFQKVVPDDQPFAGPLMGMAAVLRQAAAAGVSRLVFAAADMPLIDSADVARLLGALAQDASAAGAMHRWMTGPSTGAVEPMPSAWRVAQADELLTRAIAAGARGPSRLADDPAVRCLPLRHDHDAIRWRSVNTRQDMQALAHAAGLRIEATP